MSNLAPPPYLSQADDSVSQRLYPVSGEDKPIPSAPPAPPEISLQPFPMYVVQPGVQAGGYVAVPLEAPPAEASAAPQPNILPPNELVICMFYTLALNDHNST